MKLWIKAQQGRARAKQAEAKQALAERRRLDEVKKLERRLESVEMEFRKLLGAVRVKLLGRDRFYTTAPSNLTDVIICSAAVAQFSTGQGKSSSRDLVNLIRRFSIDERYNCEEDDASTKWWDLPAPGIRKRTAVRSTSKEEYSIS